ncbi:ubiquitin-like domain-containing protein CIP73 [Euphorbia lathyris]|uniref:ubiquitin-like domain-containing protein CIP73 n=1 Tax=Euphorbia lathyris TaxID=212925 RepID=UPI003313CB19
MADQYSNEGSSTRNISGDGSNATVELNVKTIDSRIYSFQVDKNMPVSAFKEKIATEVGVPVGHQRLIFRGKVLKDEHLLSEYQVDNGHTLHMVVRQPQSSAETSSGDTNANRGNDANSGTPQNRIGQISHSVVLGTLNVGDSGEGVVPDFSRVIGAVLNSFGIGGQTAISGIGGMQPSTMPSGQTPQGNETAGASRTDGSGQGQTGNQTQTGQAFPGQPFQSLPQVMQIPVTAAVPLPSIHSPIPDALRTLSEFMTCLDQSLAQDVSQPNNSPNSTRDMPRAELPSNIRGLQALSIVLRQAERLLGDRAVATLSHIAGRLEQEGASSDPSTRSQIQAESTYVGLAMQHLGALFLELGRTMLTLQMGHPPAEAFVNSGPAVYISPSGPNPIMVQPFPLQTNSLFGGSATQPNPVTVGVGNVPRNINIHIHAGTSLAPVLSNVATRTSNGEGMQGEQGNGIGSASSGPVRVLPLRNVVAAVPSRSTGVAVSSGAQPGLGVSVSQPPAEQTLASSLVADINSRIRDLVGTMQGDLPASGAVSSGAGNDASNEQHNVTADNGAAESTENSSGLTSDGNDRKKHDEHAQGSNGDAVESFSISKDVPPGSVGCSSKETSIKSEGTSENVPSSTEKYDPSENVQTIPLGLGMGSLDRKRRTRQPKPLVDGTGSTPASQNLNSGTSSQQLLQSLASHLSGANSSGVNNAGAGPIPPSDGMNPESGLLGQQNSAAPLDTADMMSQVIQSPALNGLLAGFSDQTGVGSPNVLRDMLQQLTQNPQVMSTVGQIAQQVENQGLGNMFSGLGGGQGGGLDLSRMMQQMMPVVSQVLGHGGPGTQSFSPLESEPQQNYSGRSLDGNGNVQIDLQEVAQRIGQLNTPEDIFLAVAENAVRLNDNETEVSILNELSNNEDIINEYMEVLQNDIHWRLESERGQQDK